MFLHILAVTLIFGQFQNCAPLESPEAVTNAFVDFEAPGGRELASSLLDESDTDTTQSDPEETPATPPPVVPNPVTPTPPPPMNPPVVVNPCTGRSAPAPVLLGEQVGEVLNENFRNVGFNSGLGDSNTGNRSGTSGTRTVQVRASQSATSRVRLSLRCQMVGPNPRLTVNCNEQVFNNANAAGVQGISFTIQAPQNSQCISGGYTTELWVRDECGLESAKKTFQITINNVCRPERKLVAYNDASQNGKFGSAVAMRGNTAVVVAEGDDQVARNVGAAYVFELSGGTWTQTQKLLPSDGGSVADLTDGEMSSVSLDGNWLALGVPYHGRHGAVYVFEKSGANWVQRQRIIPAAAQANPGGSDFFGFSVSLSGSVLAIGAPRDAANGVQAGAVYRYVLSGTQWAYNEKLTGDARDFQWLGFSVAALGSRIVAGAPTNANNGANGNGTLQVFTQSGSSTSRQSLVGSGRTSGDRLGFSVAIANNRVVGGSPETTDGNNRPGAVHMFTLEGTNWRHFRLLGRNTTSFGSSLSLDNNRLLVGAPFDNGRRGAVFAHTVVDATNVLVDRIAGNQEYSKHVARGRSAEDQFGASVSQSNGKALVGSWLDTLSRNELAGSADVTNGGSAYVIDLP